ncbi:LysR family transcriptional regulator [Pyxidicoccus fallax]|uniref:LysR family transcriptional regulator n=1 Tax=Pyxidicoccus fallax TaxID=394095 RepID=A0A848L629_9BACT|nr:LysR family transcriptional regulator [Pyxidicoccus fallax]NMO14179.1 LysR family transcriptional regulator [Pyxidicoccus fallax]NPC80363.1 LysR family transcriptional regulator [Pyxidicoccus fallax]
MPILDGELLRAFAAFADTLNFTRAAARVGLSQPALFERVKRLSDEVGAVLYERSGRHIHLTETGARVAAFAREQLERSQAFLDDLRGEARRETVVLAAGEGTYLYLLGPLLRRFARDEGADSLHLLTRGAPSAAEAVREGAAHLAVGVLDLVPDGLIARELLRTPLCVAVAESHPLASRRTVRLSELARERLILTPSGQSHRDFVGRALGGSGHEVRAPLEADGWPLMLHFAALGLGLAIVNGTCVLPAGVVARPVPELGMVTYKVMWRRDGALPPAASRLRERILALSRASEEKAAPAKPTPSVGSRTARR